MNEVEIFVPGRLCLFGEHSDWMSECYGLRENIGFVVGSSIVVGIEQGIYATAKKVNDEEVFIYHSVLSDEICAFSSFNIDDFDSMRKIMESDDFDSYVVGVAYVMYTMFDVGPIHITVTKQTLPLKKGLSSSAAICVLVAKAFNEVYELNLSIEEIMNIAYLGEINAKSECGRLDQVCAFGNVITKIGFLADNTSIYMPLECDKKMYLVFADLHAFKDTRAILSSLKEAYKHGDKNTKERFDEYFLSHNKNIVNQAKIIIKYGDSEELGELMTLSENLFNEYIRPYSIYLNSPVLDFVLADEYIKTLTYGGKGVGSHGDGSVQFVARDKYTQKILCRYLTDRLGMSAYPITLG